MRVTVRSGHKRLRVSASPEVPPTSDHTEGDRASAAATPSRKRPRTMAEPDRPKARIMTPTSFLWCLDVLDRLMKDPAGRVFNKLRGRAGSRVLELIDFETVKYNLDEGDYGSADEFAEDVLLTLTTAMELGSPLVGKEVRRLATRVLGMFETEWKQCRDNLKPKKFNVKESESSVVLSTVTHPSRGSYDQKSSAGTGLVESRSSAGSCTKSSIMSSCSSRERAELYRSINSTRQLRRQDDIKRQREAARRKIEGMKGTAGLMDNFESMIEFEKLLTGNQSCYGTIRMYTRHRR